MEKPSRFILIALITLCGSATSPLRGAAPPNIVFILADDVGQEVLGCYGGLSYGTPRLDRLAREGMRFEHAYSMPVCHPSRVCLLTGRYPFRFGSVPWGTFPAAAEAQTLPRLLKSAGYATAVAGKWQLTLLGKDPEHPHRLGFDEYSLFGWHEGPRYYRPLIRQNGKVRKDVEDRYGPDVYCDFLIDFIERHQGGPFFAFYSMALCHDVTDDLDAPVPVGPRGRYDSYREMAEGMDDRVGRLVGAIDRLGLAERTVIVFTGDNGTARRSIITARDGELFREPVSSLRGSSVVPGGKGKLTDGGTRVPLLVRWTGTTVAGGVSEQLVDFSDFLPTFAELAGKAVPDDFTIDGKSFASSFRGGSAGGRRWAFAQQGKASWVRTQRWKLYRDGRLIDLRGDPRETTALSDEDGDEDGSEATQEAREARAELGAAIKALFSK